METLEGARRDLPQVTGLISLMTSSHSQVTDSGLRLRSRQGLPANAVPGPIPGVLPKLGRAGPLRDTFGEVYGLVSVQSFRGHN